MGDEHDFSQFWRTLNALMQRKTELPPPVPAPAPAAGSPAASPRGSPTQEAPNSATSNAGAVEAMRGRPRRISLQLTDRGSRHLHNVQRVLSQSGNAVVQTEYSRATGDLLCTLAAPVTGAALQSIRDMDGVLQVSLLEE